VIDTSIGHRTPSFRRLGFTASGLAALLERARGRWAGMRLPRPDDACHQMPPLLTQVERPIAQDSLHARPATLRDLSILAVDDDPGTLELIGMLFETYGARVTGAVSAEGALASLSRMPEDAPYGLLLSDIGLPGMDGYELLQTVRQKLEIGPRRLPAIAVTAYARTEDRAMALHSGFQAHLPKPYDAEQLVATALRLIGQATRSGA
jgi:CheY-like chemotaxis protein